MKESKLNLDPTKRLINSLSILMILGPGFLDFFTAISVNDQDKKVDMTINGLIIVFIGLPLLLVIIGLGNESVDRWRKKTDPEKKLWPAWLQIVGALINLVVFPLGLMLVKNLPALLRALW